MNYLRGVIFIGDLLRAFADIGVSDPQVVAVIARILGFDVEPVRVEPSLELPPTTLPQPKPSTGKQAEPPREPVTNSSMLEEPFDPQADPAASPGNPSATDVSTTMALLTPFDLERLPQTEPSRPKPAAEWSGWGQPSGEPLPHQPLLLPDWTRGILNEAVATWQALGAPDLQSAVDILARGEALDHFPCVAAPTLAQGCQVLSDVSTGMTPFARDSWHLIQTLRAVVGRERVEVLYFEDCPIHGVEAEPDLDFKQYIPPTRGRPVLLISDLGIANPPFSLRRATPRDWLELHLRLKEAGCPVVALVPYPPSRWPQALAHVLSIIHWDRRTSATTVRYARQRR